MTKLLSDSDSDSVSDTKLLTFSVVGNSLVAHFTAISAVECCSGECGSMKNQQELKIWQKRLHFLNQEFRNTISRQ